jgi:hypothetical protein
MMPFARSQAVSGLVLVTCLCWSFGAGADATLRSSAEGQKTYVTRQGNGWLVERLAPTANESQIPMGPMASLPDSRNPDAVWEALIDARVMTALASLPSIKRDAGQKLPDVVEPALVRNWAEFVEPELAMRWSLLAERNGFSGAMLHVPEAGLGRAHPLVRWPLGRSEGHANTWRNVVSEGAARDLNSQQALQEWLTLPSPAPAANPWLKGLKAYRY